MMFVYNLLHTQCVTTEAPNSHSSFCLLDSLENGHNVHDLAVNQR